MVERNTKKFNILFTSSDKFPPFRVDVSVLIGREMVGRGHRIDWVLQSAEKTEASYTTLWSGCNVWVGRNNDGESRYARALKNIYSFVHDINSVKLMMRFHYDVVVIKDKFLTAILALTAAKLRGVNVVYWLSYPFPEDFLFQLKQGIAKYRMLYWVKGYFFKALLYRVLLPLSDHVFVQTEQMRKNIAALGISSSKMTPVPMGVSVQKIPFFWYQPGISQNGQKRVVYLGTLSKNRHLSFLIRSFAMVLQKQKDAKLYLVGGGDFDTDEQYLEEEARRLGVLKSIFITGFIPQEDAWEYVKRADVCVSPLFPSPILDCGFSTKLIEYMALGKAVVANEHPEQSKIINDSKAGICTSYKEKPFADAILFLLEHPETAKRMGLSGRHYVSRNYNYTNIADLVESRFSQVVSD